MTHSPDDEAKLVMLYVTVPDMACGKAIARSAVSHKLAACANILPVMTAIYQWQGVLEEGNEAVLLLKTRQTLVVALMEHVVNQHPYDTPCIMELPLGRINGGYATWLTAQLQ
ncbi:divalent-cation tolerance protein CutA [Thalassospira mesophila]|uniref:Cation tolerance protein CutA n=1 Tax=Thalassospira mesophila TaxID=1293891 RepID=A0A1Y2KYR0_9PROT|nr:divalent-cation tolerance protein CutA [Thalassospira mesophila]OSQ37851.1 cation tolerance protein CutA [Thalassospira mesophila]